MLTTPETRTTKPDGPSPNGALRVVRAGFIPLVDAAPVIVAREKGFARAEGLTLELSRETSWATLRDRLVVKQFDVAHMLAPLPVASTLGLMALSVPMVVPLVLCLGGNALTVSTALAARLALGVGAPASEVVAAIGREVRAGGAKLTFAVTHPFSTHAYELRHVLAAGGVDPDRDVRLVVIPPPFMADALREGQIDGFYVGAPWSSLAVEAGSGVIVTTKPELFGQVPEKVLGLRADFAAASPDTLARLIRALDAAMGWCGREENHDELAEMLAAPEHVGAPAAIIRRCLSGALVRRPGGGPEPVDDYLVFDRQGPDFPSASHGLWTYAAMARWGHVTMTPEGIAAVIATFRPDLHAAALGRPAPAGDLVPLAGADRFDGRDFDPADLPGYLAGLPIRATRAADADHDD